MMGAVWARSRGLSYRVCGILGGVDTKGVELVGCWERGEWILRALGSGLFGTGGLGEERVPQVGGVLDCSWGGGGSGWRC